VSPEVVVGPEGQVSDVRLVVLVVPHNGRRQLLLLSVSASSAVGCGVGHADHAPQVGRAQPALLVVVRAVQLPPLLLQRKVSQSGGVRYWKWQLSLEKATFGNKRRYPNRKVVMFPVQPSIF
jgi:hypothetical protein